jgi:hypothetical protein
VAGAVYWAVTRGMALLDALLASQGR